MPARTVLNSTRACHLITRPALTSHESSGTSTGKNGQKILLWPERNPTDRINPQSPLRVVPPRKKPQSPPTRRRACKLPLGEPPPPMTNKRILLYTFIALLLGTLFYLQFRAWRTFDWVVFLTQTRQIDLLPILLGIAFTYLAYLMRALRWKIFLRPVKETTAASLIAPTIIGFTGISLLGRLGEMIRPYLIARKVGLSFSS